MSPQAIKREREALQKERDRLLDRIRRSRKRIEDDRRAADTAERKLRRLAVLESVGVPDGVRVRYRGLFRDRRFDEALGVVVECKRTRCLVDFGELGRWRMPIDEVLPVASGEPQGSWMALPCVRKGGER